MLLSLARVCTRIWKKQWQPYHSGNPKGARGKRRERPTNQDPNIGCQEFSYLDATLRKSQAFPRKFLGRCDVVEETKKSRNRYLIFILFTLIILFVQERRKRESKKWVELANGSKRKSVKKKNTMWRIWHEWIMEKKGELIALNVVKNRASTCSKSR